MTLDIPKPIADYVAADKVSGDAVALCFTENATVIDENCTYVGRSEISQWRNDAISKYNYTVEPIGMTENNGVFIITGHVAGDFPGSPVDLTYSFVLDGDKIASLEIA